MQNTIHRNSHSITNVRTQNVRRDAANDAPQQNSNVDSYVPAQQDSEAGLYDPRLFRQRFGNGSSNGTSGSIHSDNNQAGRSDGYGGRRFSTTGPARAVDRYRQHGNQEMDLSDRRQVGQLISRSPQIDNQRSTDDDQNRCGGAAIFNAMLLDGDHAQNARAIRETMGNELSPGQRQALDHMEAGRLTPSEAAQLQEAIYDHGEGLNGRQDNGLDRTDMRRTVSELRQHGAFGNTQEMNFRRETVDSTSGASHWTVSTRTNHGTHFADSYPQDNGYARVTGGDEAAFAPWDAEDRPMEDSVSLRGNGIQERFPGARGEWQQRDYSLSQAANPASRPTAHGLPADL